MRKRYLFFVLFVFSFHIVEAQMNNEFSLQNYHPASPTQFQFSKYLEMPVNEYTGVPNISIPLFQTVIDELTIPVTLTYHAGGIRVNQEASWVGLGWDLRFGSISQEINDRDDFDLQTIYKKPDWNESPIPSFYSQKYSNIYFCLENVGWNNSVPIIPLKALYSYRIFSAYPITLGYGPHCSDAVLGHAYVLPIEGQVDNQPLATDIIEHPNYDSEPDIFTASFFGHTIKFICDENNSTFIVLNKKGYKVQKNGNSFVIFTPVGEKFYFEKSSTVNSFTVSKEGIYSGLTSSTSQNLPSSRTWFITKIVTKNKQDILFNYASLGVHKNYPNYSEKYDKVLGNPTPQLISGICGGVQGYVNYGIDGITKTYSYAEEEKVTLTSISFYNGNITFSNSGREDVLGGTKLSDITINSLEGVVKNYRLNYSYFEAQYAVGGYYTPEINPENYGNTAKLRLKLLSIDENGRSAYNFYYNSTQMPTKNSFAQDFWGFYNGYLNNYSLIPNPARLDNSQIPVQGLQDNGNNNSARVEYTKAGILEMIKYPTGGTVDFEYELNTFNNYLVPDFNTTANLFSSGNGLRVHAINYKTDNTSNINKRTIYEYEGGKASIELKIGKIFSINSLQLSTDINPHYSSTYTSICEINGHGFYSTNSLGSGNYVGYDKVVQKETDNSGNSLGRTEKYFSNNPDVSGINPNYTSTQISYSLPCLKKISFSVPSYNSDIVENGKVISINMYDKQGILVKNIENNYFTQVSDIYYGVRFFNEPNLYYHKGGHDGIPFSWGSVPKSTAGYYPIYDIESILDKETITGIDATGNEMVTYTMYGYDINNVLSSKVTRTSTNEYLYEYFEHAYEYYLRTGNNILINAHRFSDLTQYSKIIRKPDNSNPTLIYLGDKYYQQYGDKVLLVKTVVNEHPEQNDEKTTITYDEFDQNTGKALQYSSKGQIKSLMWDNSGEYLIAEVINAGIKEVAATSFEIEDLQGSNFIFLTDGRLLDNSAPTGKYIFDLNVSSLSTADVNPVKKYIVSYWLKSGSGICNVNGYAGNFVLEKNGWQLYQCTLGFGTDEIIITGNGKIDELRSHPIDALISTYTYKPLVGITSLCDQNNIIRYFEYDGEQRLKIIRDFDRNIINKFCYNYTGQETECHSTFNAGPWWTATGETVCLPCEENPEFSGNVRKHKEIDSNPDSPTYGEPRWVIEGPGSCVASAEWRVAERWCEQNNQGLHTGNLISTMLDINPCSQTYQELRDFVTQNSPDCPNEVIPCTTECNQPQYKCVNGVCELGVWSVVKVKKNVKTELWDCLYAYCFSDGTISAYYSIVSTDNPCTITCY